MRRLLAPGVVLSVLVAALALTSGTSEASDRLLDHARHGQGAIDALGSHLDQAAARNRMSATKLRRILAHDPTAWLGNQGRLFYVEEAPDTTAASAPVSPAAAPYPLDQTFALHSLPGSQHTIYLDFDGYTLAAGGFWTSGGGGMTAGTFDGFSLDSDPAFSDAEKELIQQVWQITAEKYAPFDIDVTTQDAGAAAYNRNGAGDPTYGDHVVFTDDPNAVNQACSGNCAGVAVVGGFDEPSDNSDELEPAWVFTSKTYDAPALIAHTAAHEIGHTLGLHHDGVTGGPEYYDGQGNWFPLMGSSINAVGQFSKGEYPLANNTEDDLAVIASYGAPLRADDYGNTTGTAANLGALSSYTLDGVIGSSADKDVFKVTRACVGDLTAAASGIGEGQAVDLAVTVLDSGGASLTSDDPPSDQDGSWPHKPIGLDASATVTGAAAGTYYVQVDGVGRLTPTTGGYSDYASIGNYHLTITGCAGAGGSAPAQPATVTATPTSHGTTGTITWTVPGDDGGSPVTGYTITGLPTGTDNVGASTFSYPASNLVPGTTYTVGVAATNPHGTGPARTASLRVPTWAPTSAPDLSVSVSGTQATAGWAAPANPGHAIITGWLVQVLSGSTVLYQATGGPSVHLATISGFTAGSYSFRVTVQVTADDPSGVTAANRSFTIVTAPGAPRIGTASTGARGRPVNATARWAAPLNTGATAITGYRVKAYKLNSAGQVVRVFTSTMLAGSRRSYVFALPAARYRFRVIAYNRVGSSPLSSYSRVVTSR
jgi:hypothetical protein